jgi:hypothetical protein
VSIVTCQRGELKFDNLGGVITAIVDQYGAREESIKLADRVVSGKRLAVSRGRKQGGTPFGYDREIVDEAGRTVRRLSAIEQFQKPPAWSSRLVPSDDRRAVEAVKLMFERAAAGASLGSVARELNRGGYTTMHGKRFSATAVRRAVANPVYVGTVAAGCKRRRGKFRSLHDDGGVVCENAHEPLIDRVTFERAQRRLGRNPTTPRSPVPGKYLLTGLVRLAGTDRRLQGFTMSHSGRKVVRRYYALPPRYFEEYPEESDRPGFRADTVERGVLAKLKQYMSDERNRRTVHNEIARRTKKTEAAVGNLESRLADLRAKIERATENLALAAREDVPGVTRLLVGWRDQEAQLREKMRQATGRQAPSPEALEVLGRLDELLEDLDQADREKLAFAVRQTVKRITLRRERRGDGKHRITLWDGAIELRDELGVGAVIPLADEDIPSPGRWRDAAAFVRGRPGPAFIGDVAVALGITRMTASRLLAQAVLAGKIRKIGHQKGWEAVRPAREVVRKLSAS